MSFSSSIQSPQNAQSMTIMSISRSTGINHVYRVPRPKRHRRRSSAPDIRL